MKELWEQFERWLSDNWPEGLADLNPPATEEEIKELEQALGIVLPANFIECLKVHNGQKSDAGGLFDNSEFLSTDSILDQWKVWKDLLDSGDFDGIKSEPAEGIKDDWWNAKWVPITHNGGGDHYCIDLDPTDEGRLGQVITMWHDMGSRELQAGSFREWLEKYIKAVLAGQYVYSEDFGGLIDVNYA